MEPSHPTARADHPVQRRWQLAFPSALRAFHRVDGLAWNELPEFGVFLAPLAKGKISNKGTCLDLDLVLGIPLERNDLTAWTNGIAATDVQVERECVRQADNLPETQGVRRGGGEELSNQSLNRFRE